MFVSRGFRGFRRFSGLYLEEQRVSKKLGVGFELFFRV